MSNKINKNILDLHNLIRIKKKPYIKNKKKQKIIVLTSAVCRPKLHLECFNKDLLDNFKNISHKYDIKWIINIDKTLKCKYTTEQTKNNFEKIFNLCDIDLNFILTKEPSYFNSCKNLVNEALKISSNDSCILILQDDFILNKTLDLDEIITKYFVKNSYISLVFNKFCTFPPSIIGYNILLHYVRIFNKKYNKLIFKKSGMDFLTRAYFRNLSIKKDIPINYFLINYDINDLEVLLSKKDIVISKRKINQKINKQTFGNSSFICDELRQNERNQNYLITSKNLLNKKMEKLIESCSEKKINIISYNEFKKIKNKQFCFKFIRFNGIHSYLDEDCKINYNNTYFKDQGRPYIIDNKHSKMSNYSITPKTLDHLLKKNNIILAKYEYKNKEGNRKYIKKFYDSLLKFKLKCVIFHTSLCKKFINNYETNDIKFIKYYDANYEDKSDIYLFYSFLKNKNYDNVIICNISNIEFITNPFITFNYKKEFIYLINTKNNNEELIKNKKFKKKIIKLFGSFDMFSIIRNKTIVSNEFIGGNYDIVIDFCIETINFFNKIYNNDMIKLLTKKNIEKILYNYIIYSNNKFKKKIIKGIYKPYSSSKYFNKNIEYIFKKKINNEYNKIHWV